MLPLLPGLASIAVLIYSVWCGLGLTFDSYNYLSAARAIAEGRPMVTQLGVKYVAQPPLFPAVLSLWNGNLLATKVFNIILLAGTLCLIWKLIHFGLHGIGYKIFACFSVFLSTPLILVHSFLWSEALFLFLIQFAVVTLYFFYQTKRRRLLFVLVVLSLLLCAQRNAGIFIVSGIFLGLFLNGSSVKERIVLVGALLISVTGFFFWNLRGYLTEGGDFLDGGYLQDFGGNFLRYSSAIGVWFLPPTVNSFFLIFAGFFSLLVVISLLFRFTPATDNGLLFKHLAIIIVVYLIGFIILGRPVESDIERFLSGIFPIYLVVVVRGIERIQIRGKKWIILPLSAMLLYGLVRAGNNANRWHESRCKTTVSLFANK